MLGKAASLGKLATFANDVARGALSNALTQGVSIAAGLQKKFDWVGVAVGGAVGGAVGVANRVLAANGTGVRADAIKDTTARNAGFYANQALSGMAGSIAGAATRSVITGTDFGDNVMATLPDVIGSTIGGMIARGVSGPKRPIEGSGVPFIRGIRTNFGYGDSTSLRESIIFRRRSS